MTAISADNIERYAVVGNPVAHSRSPQIHQAFAQQFAAQITYEKVLVEPGQFAAFVDQFAAQGGAGMNVTVPFKADAFAYADETDELATAAQAVNTLVFREGHPVLGYNTDGIGLCNDLQQRYAVEVRGINVLILGAGGAASGVLQPLLALSPNKLVVANRTLSKAQELVQHHLQFLPAGAPLACSRFEQLQGNFDLVINATSTGLSGDTVRIAPAIVEHAFCYDMSYGPAALFCRWAQQQGAAQSVDGLGMLVEQAAQSFFLWRNQRPQTEPVVKMLRASL